MKELTTAFGNFQVEDDQMIEETQPVVVPPVVPPEGGDEEEGNGVEKPEGLPAPEDTPPVVPVVPEEGAEGEGGLGFDKVVEELEGEGVFFLGEEETFEESPEGMAKMMKANLAKFREKTEEEFKEKYGISESEEIPEEYFSKLDPANKTHAEEMVRANLKSAGYTDDEVNDAVTDIVSRDKLTEEATKAKRIIVGKEKQYIETAKTNVAAAETARVEKRDKIVTGMKSDIDALDEVSGFKLDDSRKEAFKEYLFKAGADGKTAAQRNAKDPKRRIRLAFLDFIDANKGDFEIKATTAVVNKLKKKTTRFTPKAAVSGKPVNRREEEGTDQIDFTVLDTFI